MAIQRSNLFQDVPIAPGREQIETLLETEAFRLEHIVSMGHRTPDGEWYDQDRDEWVALLSGQARLRFENPPEEIDLTPGDCVIIPRGRRHRVEWTEPDRPSVWVTLHHFSEGGTLSRP